MFVQLWFNFIRAILMEPTGKVLMGQQVKEAPVESTRMKR